jgi:hypothetical protein
MGETLRIRNDGGKVASRAVLEAREIATGKASRPDGLVVNEGDKDVS